MASSGLAVTGELPIDVAVCFLGLLPQQGVENNGSNPHRCKSNTEYAIAHD